MEWFQKARQGGYPDQELAQLNQQRVALAGSRIEIAVQTYRTQNGDRLPTSLAELSSSGILAESPKDPWGREIAYIPSPDGKTYSLFSVGPDGAPRTSDDIVALQSGPISGCRNCCWQRRTSDAVVEGLARQDLELADLLAPVKIEAGAFRGLKNTLVNR